MSQFLFIDDSRIEELAISGLGGLLVSDEEYRRLQAELRKTKLEMYGNAFAPVKWSPPGGDDSLFYQQRAGNANLLRERVCDLLGTTSGTLVLALIDEQGTPLDQRRRLYYAKQALEFTCQRVELHSRQTASGQITLIAEIPGSGLEGELSRHFYTIRKDGCKYPKFNLELNQFNRTMFMSHDYMCEGIQLVDIAVGAACYATKGRGQQFLDRFKAKIRRGANGVKGYGIVVYPSNSAAVDGLCAMC